MCLYLHRMARCYPLSRTSSFYGYLRVKSSCCIIFFYLSLTQEVSEVLEQQRHLMKKVLDDTRLNRLRLEGGTVLARIRKEEACENENYK